MIIQLHPDREGHWALYERFEQRCVEFGERSGWPINAELRKEIRQRFVATPVLAGYFVTENLSAHILSWCLVVYGRPGIMLYQCEGEAGEIAPLFPEFFNTALPTWIEEIEKAIKRPIEFVEIDVESAHEQAWTQLLGHYRRIIARRTMTVFDLQPMRESEHSASGVRQ